MRGSRRLTPYASSWLIVTRDGPAASTAPSDAWFNALASAAKSGPSIAFAFAFARLSASSGVGVPELLSEIQDSSESDNSESDARYGR